MSVNADLQTIFHIYCEGVFYYVQGGSNMTGTDLYVNKPQSVPVICEPPCILISLR